MIERPTVTGLPAAVTFGNSNGAGTITLTGSQHLEASLGYAVGEGIYIQGTGTNGNGATFTGNNFYTIAAIAGATLTLEGGETLTVAANVAATLAPITLTSSTTGFLSPVPTEVSFNYQSGVATISLANGGSWEALGYTVGQGIYVQGTGANGDGSTFTGSNYYTIAAISGATLTLQAGDVLTLNLT